MRRFGPKTGIDFSHFGLDSGMVFKETNEMYERIYRFLSRWIRTKEKYANSKWVLTNLFCWRSNVSNDDKISLTWNGCKNTLRKQPTFGDATSGFPAKVRLINECRNSILMTRHYPDLGSASDWLIQIFHAARPISSTTQIWVVLLIGQFGISALVSQTFISRGNQWWRREISAVYSS